MKVSPPPQLQVNRFCQETGRFWSAQPTGPVRKPVGLVSTTDRFCQETGRFGHRFFRRATEVQVGVLQEVYLLRKVGIDVCKDISCG